MNNGYSQYYPAMIATLRENFATDPENTYYITGAPQCPIPEPNMGIIIGNATFDYLWIQFYNNNNYTYPCALPFNGNAAFNCEYRPRVNVRLLPAPFRPFEYLWTPIKDI